MAKKLLEQVTDKIRLKGYSSFPRPRVGTQRDAEY